MIREISIKNFKSFNQEQTFSMEADTSNVHEHPDHLVSVNGLELLKVSSIYGLNGGGKSNLLKALKLACYLVGNPVGFSDPRLKFSDASLFDSCRFSTSNIISESLVFINADFEIQYSFDVRVRPKYGSIIDPTSNFNSLDFMNIEFVREEISFREKGKTRFVPLFSRSESGLVTSAFFKAPLVFSPKVAFKSNISVVRYLCCSPADSAEGSSIEYQVINSLMNELCSIKEIGIFPGSVEETFLFSSVADEKIKAFIIKGLNCMDIKITDLIIKGGEKGVYDVLLERTLGTKKYLFDLNDESDGTRKLFSILLTFALSMDQPAIFIADDLDAALHPKLIAAILQFMNKPENKINQFIYNSHDITNMNSENFRRDEIWFAYRDDNYATQLVPLSNIVDYKNKHIRNDAVYSKQYMEGKYPAYPVVEEDLSWKLSSD